MKLAALLSLRVLVTIFLVLTAVAGIGACSRDVPVLTGATMGTTYSVIVPKLKRADQEPLKANIDASLVSVNNAMSTYQEDSAITRFNQSTSTDWIKVPVSFTTVASAALDIARDSAGAFDPTVGPLVRRWGFGKNEDDNIPTHDEIASLMAYIGFDKFAVDAAKSLVKKSDPSVQVDFNAIAKGYAVDQLAAEVESFGYRDYLVEIGGELRVGGKNDKGEPWRIGIERPDSGVADKAAQTGLSLTAGGIATSGDYRNAFESNGVRYSHIIDARSGAPVSHALASVTVVADSAMLADGWATALMVLGPDNGMKIAEDLGLACLFIVREEQGFQTRSSPAFDQL